MSVENNKDTFRGVFSRLFYYTNSLFVESVVRSIDAASAESMLCVARSCD